MTIEISDVSGLDTRLSEIDEKFDRLVRTLRAAFGDGEAQDHAFHLAQIADLEKRLETARVWSSEQNFLIVEVAHALGLNGGITKENLLRAAKKRGKSK